MAIKMKLYCNVFVTCAPLCTIHEHALRDRLLAPLWINLATIFTQLGGYGMLSMLSVAYSINGKVEHKNRFTLFEQNGFTRRVTLLN